MNEWEGGEGVTVVIPAIPPRRFTLLPRAVASVYRQTYPIAGISLAFDTHREGAAATRGRALAGVRTRWASFLDDDDEYYEEHIAKLMRCAIETGADYVFSYWDLSRTFNVFATPENPMGHFGRPFDPANPHHTTMTVLVRTELAQAVGFTPRPAGDIAGGEDWRFTLGCVAAGAHIVHLPEQTWFWRHHGHNTSGREDRW